jgi:hypothetical protein
MLILEQKIIFYSIRETRCSQVLGKPIAVFQRIQIITILMDPALSEVNKIHRLITVHCFPF